MRGVTEQVFQRDLLVDISTRTPHAGSDAPPGLHREVQLISTRTPHAGSDASCWPLSDSAFIFQPALPMRGVTVL